MDRERGSHPSSVCILLFTPTPHKPGKTRVRSEELWAGGGGGGRLLSQLEGRATHSHSNAYVVGDEGHYTGDAFRTSDGAECGFIRTIYSITTTEREQWDFCVVIFRK